MRHIQGYLAVAVVAAGLVVTPSGANAQDAPLPKVSAIGKTVVVNREDDAQQKGTLLTISDRSITVKTKTGEQNIALDTIRDVRLPSHAVSKGFLLGAIGGMVLSVAEGYCNCDYGPEIMFWPAIGAGVGAGAGAILRALTHSSQVVYEREPRPTATLTPIVLKSRLGALVTLSW